jgi:hypothetical protein
MSQYKKVTTFKCNLCTEGNKASENFPDSYSSVAEVKTHIKVHHQGMSVTIGYGLDDIYTVTLRYFVTQEEMTNWVQNANALEGCASMGSTDSSWKGEGWYATDDFSNGYWKAIPIPKFIDEKRAIAANRLLKGQGEWNAILKLRQDIAHALHIKLDEVAPPTMPE